ncbi:MAG TPA: hypothetical protein VL021_01525 [Brumimicrobium sp.]|nr:hypothetical protein [Brumimicrobium sp.]
MKKVLLFGAVLGLFAITSCEKKHTCTKDGVDVTYAEKDFSDIELAIIKTACEESGGKWK